MIEFCCVGQVLLTLLCHSGCLASFSHVFGYFGAIWGASMVVYWNDWYSENYSIDPEVGE
jgi:hypothetical protein